MEFSYDTLTDEQREYFLTYIWNGVGSRDFSVTPPQLIFRGPSAYHDFAYWLGGTEEDRNKADKQFLIDELDQVRREKHITQKPFYFMMAYVYYLGLAAIGKKAFEYGGPRTNWEEYKSYYEKRQAEYKNAPKSMAHKLVDKYFSFRR